ncbi:hypothetical protein Gpo141_00012989, partial [Globisporangium polare]
RHAHAFESSGASLYYFDANTSEKLRLAIAEGTTTGRRSSETTGGIPMLVAPSTPSVQTRNRQSRRRVSRSSSNTTGQPVDNCACRRLAQRLVDQRASTTWKHKLPWRGTTALRPTPLLSLVKQPAAQDDDLVLTTTLLMMDAHNSDNDGDDDDGFGSFTHYGRGGNGASSSARAKGRVNVQRAAS